MTISGDLATLAQQGVQLWVEDGKLRVRAPKGALTPATRELLAARKDEILELLRFQNGSDHPLVQAEQGPVSGPVPLAPSQHSFFYDSGTHRFNRPAKPINMEVKQQVDPAMLKRAVHAVVAHHDAVRMRFRREGKIWRQINLSREDQEIYAHEDVSHVPAEKQAIALRAIAQKATKSINLANGPLIRVIHIARGSSAPNRIIVVLHHLVMDFYSASILCRDLETAYLQILAGEEVRLPPKTTSFKVWAERMSEYAHSSDLSEERAYWLSLPWDRVAAPPFDLKQYRGPVGKFRTVEASLTAEETETVMQNVPVQFGIPGLTVLLTALARAYTGWTGRPFYTTLLTHGRQPLFEDVDVSRTVGWFSAGYPVIIDNVDTVAPMAALRAVHEQLRAIPNGGIGYGIVRYLQSEPGLVKAPSPRIILNYRGHSEDASTKYEIFTTTRGQGSPQNDIVPTSRKLNLRGFIQNGKLQLYFNFHENMYARSTMQRLADATVEALRAFIEVHAASV